MRIADKMQFEQVKTNLGKNRAEMANLQNQAATQKRVTKPSDDPVAATRVLGNRSDIQDGDQFIKNANAAKSHLEMSEQSLGEISDVLVRAKELALSQANDASASETSRSVTAAEIEQLHDQAIQIANRKLGDRFLFGGYRTTHPPFDGEGHYLGDRGEIQIPINKESFVTMNMPGDKVFFGRGLVHGTLREESAPTSVTELKQQQAERAKNKKESQSEEPVSIRGPASVDSHHKKSQSTESVNSEQMEIEGVDVFNVLKDLQISLKTNDKEGIQESLDQLDAAIKQVVLARSQLGSRISTIDANVNSLQKANVDAKTSISNLEDADTFALVSDISKTQSTLQATLTTSGKLIQPSLLDFLK